MIKQLKQWGAGLGIYFDSKEIELLGLRENDKIDLSDIFLIQAKNLQNKSSQLKTKKEGEPEKS